MFIYQSIRNEELIDQCLVAAHSGLFNGLALTTETKSFAYLEQIINVFGIDFFWSNAASESEIYDELANMERKGLREKIDAQ